MIQESIEVLSGLDPVRKDQACIPIPLAPNHLDSRSFR